MSSETWRVARASLLGTLVGGAVGFGFGLLIAPNEGRQARRRLGYLLDRWTAQVASLRDQLRDHEVQSDARATGAALVADARQRAEQILQDANALMEEVRQRPQL